MLRTRLRQALRFPIIAALIALAAGCAAPLERGPAKTERSWVERQKILRDVAEFRMEGRLALNTGRKGYSGTISWDQNDDLLDFRFRGPFGFGGFRIHGDEDRLRVKTTGGGEFVLTDPEQEMTERFGWSLPVYSMRYWILGVSDPDLPAEEAVDSEGFLEELDQAGWHVRYDGYSESHGLVLPRRLDMQHGEVRIKVLADRWDFPAAEDPAAR